jgi:hypothetical protein
VRRGIINAIEHRQPLIQPSDPQHPHHLRLDCHEAMAAPGLAGAVGDPDQRAEPTGVAEADPSQIEQQLPGMAGDGRITPGGQAISCGKIQRVRPA